jgi:hypothetical protein
VSRILISLECLRRDMWPKVDLGLIHRVERESRETAGKSSRSLLRFRLGLVVLFFLRKTFPRDIARETFSRAKIRTMYH